MSDKKLQFSYEELIQAANVEDLTKYHNWMTNIIPLYIKNDANVDEEIKISSLNGFFEKEITFEPTDEFPNGQRSVYQSTFNLSFFAEDCPYEHPKWFRYWFYEALGSSWRHNKDLVYPYPPQKEINGYEVQLVEHLNQRTL